MTRTNLPDSGLLVISVDLELPVNQLGLPEGRRLEAVTRELLDSLARYRIAATWAVADPVHSAATDRIRAAGPDHELAILGDPTWVGVQAGRSRFSRELTRRVLGSRAAGLPVTTFIPRGPVVDDHLDLVIKHGITAVRDATQRPAGTRGVAQPYSLRFGLWELPTGLRLPGESRWLPGGGRGLRACREIDRAVAAGRLFHLVIDVPRLATAGKSAARTLQRVLRHADRRRSAKQLEIATLAQTAARLGETRPAVPSRSILRPTG